MSLNARCETRITRGDNRAVNRAERHLRAFLRGIASLPGGTLHEESGATWTETGIAWPIFDGSVGGDAPTVRKVVTLLRQSGVPFFWWTLSDTATVVTEALLKEGLRPFDADAPWEEARVADLPSLALAPGVTMERVLDEASHRTWAATLRKAYEGPPAAEAGWLEPARRLGWTKLPWRQWVAYADGEPAGVTLQFSGDGLASLWAIGVNPSMRRRGIGRALTLLPLQDVKEEVAGFFSTALGSKLYRTLGFEPTGITVTRYLWMPGAGDLKMDAARAGHRSKDE